MTQQEVQQHFNEVYFAWKNSGIQQPRPFELNEILTDFWQWLTTKTTTRNVTESVQAFQSVVTRKRYLDGGSLLEEAKNFVWTDSGIQPKTN